MDDSVDIIIPVYKESANITKLVHEIKSLNLPLCSILFVDDGSTDDTLNEIKNHGGNGFFCQYPTAPYGHNFFKR